MSYVDKPFNDSGRFDIKQSHWKCHMNIHFNDILVGKGLQPAQYSCLLKIKWMYGKR